jgi:hypothetical protein
MRGTVVKVRAWAQSPAAIVHAQGPCKVRLQPLNNELRAALEGCAVGFFEAWLPRPADPDCNWVIGQKLPDETW